MRTELISMDVAFIVALLPDGRLSREIAALSDRMAKEYGIRATHVKLPPHLSLFFRDRMRAADAKRVSKLLESDCMKLTPFTVGMDGIGYFTKAHGRTEYTVYLRVGIDSELLELHRLVDSRTRAYAKVRFKAFVPHVTVAHDGLDKTGFLAINRDYEGFRFRRSFEAKVLSVGVQKDDASQWRFKEFDFSARSAPRTSARTRAL